jgi:ATP-dependent protease ClpP protease subunit
LKTRCGITDHARKKLLNPSDVWLTAEEAIKYKLADSILNKIL